MRFALRWRHLGDRVVADKSTVTGKIVAPGDAECVKTDKLDKHFISPPLGSEKPIYLGPAPNQRNSRK